MIASSIVTIFDDLTLMPTSKSKSPSSSEDLLGASTCAGAYDMGEPKVNQDRFGCDLDRFAVCVCDGHGESGELVSQAVRDEFLARIAKVKSPTKLCELIAQRVLEDVGPVAQTSGSTFVAAHVDLDTNKLHVINVGDSRAVALLRSKSVMALSRDHKPDDPLELERIHRAGGKVYRRRGDVARVGGLALSRAFGDLALHVHGVIWDPEETITDLALVEFVVLASDGVWDVVALDELPELISKHIGEKSLDEIAELLVKECRKRWAQMTQGTYCDDVTCVLWNVHPPSSKL